MQPVAIRRARLDDLQALAEMGHALWPDSSVEDHARDLLPILQGRNVGSLPSALFLAEENLVGPVGFVLVGIRSHADGCDPTRPVGFIEGWYVTSHSRRRGTGAQLILAAEEWARAQGCVEMASDTWVDNVPSQRAHEALGFEVVDRCVHYRKRLAESPGPSSEPG